MQGRVALVAGASKGHRRGHSRGGSPPRAPPSCSVPVIPPRWRPLPSAFEAGRGQGDGRRAPDVTDAEFRAHLVDRALASYGRLDAGVPNNATDGPMPAPLADIDIGEFDRGIATNVRGTFLGMKFQIPAMLRGRRGLDRETWPRSPG